MSTVLYLDPDDEIASIKSKLEAVRAEVVDIVAPYGLQALRNPVKVRLLRRSLEALGMRATLVSRDDVTRELARAEGLRVRDGDSPAPAMLAPDVVRSHEPYVAYVHEQKARRTRLRALKAVGILAVGLAVLSPALAGLVLLPSATITLRPVTQSLDEVVQITASTLLSSVDTASLRLPARVLETDFENSARSDTQGLRKDPERPARGSVTFVNRTDSPVEVPAGTRVGTVEGVAFLTQRAISVPPGQPEGVQAPVTAANPGTPGNIGARQITRVLDPFLARSLSVANDKPMVDGSDSEHRIVNDDDYWQLRKQALTLAKEDALRRLEALKKDDTSFYHDSVRLRITREELSPQIGQEATEVALAIQGKAWVLSFNGRDVNAAVRGYFSDRDAAYAVSGNPLSVQVLEMVDADNDALAFRIRVTGAFRPRLNEEQLKDLVTGKAPREAEALLAERLALEGRPQVRTSPFWVDRVPGAPWRISIVQIPSR